MWKVVQTVGDYATPAVTFVWTQGASLLNQGSEKGQKQPSEEKRAKWIAFGKILEPVTAAVQIAMTAMLPEKTKLGFQDNKVVFYQPGYHQGLIRWNDGEGNLAFEKYNVFETSVSMLHDLYEPGTEHAQCIARIHYIMIFALLKLRNVYKDTYLPKYIDPFIRKCAEYCLKNFPDTNMKKLTMPPDIGEKDKKIIYRLFSNQEEDEKPQSNRNSESLKETKICQISKEIWEDVSELEHYTSLLEVAFRHYCSRDDKIKMQVQGNLSAIGTETDNKVKLFSDKVREDQKKSYTLSS